MTANLTLTYGSLVLTSSPYMVEYGMDTGAPANEADPQPFLLQDGEQVLSSRSSNRTLTFNVLIEASSLSALATYEANLVAETERVQNTLTVDWGDSSPAAVYEVFRASVALVRDDSWELARMRRYSVTVQALPFPRSSAQFTSVGTAPGGATTTTLDTMGATTGWTGLIDGVPATVTNTVGPPTTNSVSATVSGYVAHSFVLRKTFAATTSTTNRLVVDWKLTGVGGGYVGLSADGDGVSLPKYAEGPSPTSGYTRTWFTVAASSLAATTFTLQTQYATAGTKTFAIDNVAVTNVAPSFGTGRQQIRSVTVPGAVRTQASLAIESATSALGDGTIVYVYPGGTATAGYSPSLRQFRSSGNSVSTDATKVSGSTEPLNGSAVQFDIPIGLFPQGMYLLVGRVSTAGTPTITYQAKTIIGGTSVAFFSYTKTLAATSGYQNVVIGRLNLPTVDLDAGAAAAAVTMSLTVQASSATTYDEMWLFGTSFGQLTMLDCGTGSGAVGGAARRLWLEPASVSTPRPTIRMGYSADRSDSYYPPSLMTAGSQVGYCWQAPILNPPQVNVLTVTPNATDAAVSLSGYARWHTSPAS